MTHAELMWGNSCISLIYEATATSITMAGIFITFIIEYLGNRIVKWRASKNKISDTIDEEGIEKFEKDEVSPSSSLLNQVHGSISPNGKMSVMLLEAGILFHSILIGITLVVSGDSFFITLFIVIVFHQMFEGIALGARIAELKDTKFYVKLVMAAVFAIITPIGMAIGIGVLNQFNGNDPSTIIALGTLDSFSAGILIWTGLIEMWAHDWLFGTLASAPLLKTVCSLIALLAGLILMSLLGKWA
jgi:ZIP Zinc transporter.